MVLLHGEVVAIVAVLLYVVLVSGDGFISGSWGSRWICQGLCLG